MKLSGYSRVQIPCTFIYRTLAAPSGSIELHALGSTNPIHPVVQLLHVQSMDLTIEDLQRVYEKLIKASPKWFDLGLALGLSNHDLVNIKTKNHEDNDSCLRNMLAELLRTQRVTWGLLSDGLRANTVKLYNLADTIAG